MRNILVNADNISISYLGQILFQNLSFQIKQGDKAVIKGPSGSGKSTILNMICGFEQPDKGNITAFGIDVVNQATAARKYFSWLPQDLNFADEDTVEDIIMFPFSFRANKDIEINQLMILKQFDKLGLKTELLSSKYIDLSGGEKQRVGIIICKLLDCDIMLLDEPTSALDKASITKVIDYLLKDENLTILSVSHDDRWCDNCNNIIELT